jgi:hypothetical protein
MACLGGGSPPQFLGRDGHAEGMAGVGCGPEPAALTTAHPARVNPCSSVVPDPPPIRVQRRAAADAFPPGR